MKKILLTILLTGILLFGLTGCSSLDNIAVPDNKFTETDFADPDNKDDMYVSIKYNGRIYIPYGTQKNTITKKVIKECIGYSETDAEQRYYSLNDTDDFIAEYYVGGIMEQVSFFRATDTKDKKIEIPDYIDSLDYDYWK